MTSGRRGGAQTVKLVIETMPAGTVANRGSFGFVPQVRQPAPRRARY